MAAVQAEWAQERGMQWNRERGMHICLFPIVGDLNGHHQKWLGSTTTNRHGVSPFDFVTVSGCDSLVVGPTHSCG